MGNKSLMRVWQEMDIEEIGPRLLIAGNLGADCGNCKEVGISFEAKVCPKCGAAYKYAGMRVSSSPKEAKRMRSKRPDLILIELQDFKEAQARKKAHGFLDGDI